MIAWKLDRLGRSRPHPLGIVTSLRERGAAIPQPDRADVVPVSFLNEEQERRCGGSGLFWSGGHR